MKGIAPVLIKVPKTRDRSGHGSHFRSELLPPYIRRTKSVETVLPWLYLKGISTGDFGKAMAASGPRVVGQKPIGFWSSFRVGRRGKGYAISLKGLNLFGETSIAGAQDGYSKLVGVNVGRYICSWQNKGTFILILDLWLGCQRITTLAEFSIPIVWQVTKCTSGEVHLTNKNITLSNHVIE